MNKTRIALISTIILLIALGLMALWVIMNAPAPIALGSCISDCDRHTEEVPLVDEYIAEDICGNDCYIEWMTYVVGGFKEIGCICCDCVGSQGADLGECDYGFFLFDWMGSWLGVCEIGGK